jgi:threonine/homoserine/homoserine lactone efflux protein
MIDPSLLAAFIVACAVLCLIPGPNLALIVSNSVAHGPRYGLLTLAGTTAAMVPQLLLTSLGMTAVLTGMASWFTSLRWLGVVYLIWLGVQYWRAPVTDLTKTGAQPRSARGIFLRAFLVSISNPKTLVFYGAFFPQFVSHSKPLAPQLVTLCVVFLLVVVLVDGSWALAAGRMRTLLRMHGRLRNRLTGGLLIGAGLGLAMARKT